MNDRSPLPGSIMCHDAVLVDEFIMSCFHVVDLK